MNTDAVLALKKLAQSVKRLHEIARLKPSDVVRDATIQRFEFTFELLWKTLKLLLENRGVLADTPKAAIQQAFRLGWITNEKAYLRMLEARNKTSHIYDEEEAEQIFKQIRKTFIKPIQTTLAKLKTVP